MTGSSGVFIALGLWGCLLNLIMAFFIRTSPIIKRRINFCISYMAIINAVNLFANSMAKICDGSNTVAGRFLVPVLNFLIYELNYFLLFILVRFCIVSLGEDGHKPRAWHIIAYSLCGLATLSVIVSQFSGYYYYINDENEYIRAGGYWISQDFAIMIFLLLLFVIIRSKNRVGGKQLLSIILFMTSPILAMLLQYWIYEEALLNMMNTLTIFLIIVLSLIDQSQDSLEHEKELSKLNIKIMLSQIQPHFLYNTLNSIYYLCEKNPKKAQEAIAQFSDFLRGNMNSLAKDEPVEFEKELQHVDNYLKLEKLRFDDDLRIEYDIEVLDFKVPALSLQPLVENAVKHGIGKAPNGGTLYIASKESENAYEILIKDDGVGFDPARSETDGNLHVGIANVKKRLETMCGGTLEIWTKIGKGTKILITIPK